MELGDPYPNGLGVNASEVDGGHVDWHWGGHSEVVLHSGEIDAVHWVLQVELSDVVALYCFQLHGVESNRLPSHAQSDELGRVSTRSLPPLSWSATQSAQRAVLICGISERTEEELADLWGRGKVVDVILGLPHIDGSNGEVVGVIQTHQSDSLLGPSKALTILEGIAWSASSAVLSTILYTSSSVGETNFTKQEELFRALRANSIDILHTLPVLLLTLEEPIEEVATCTREALELVVVRRLETGRVEGRADCVGV